MFRRRRIAFIRPRGIVVACAAALNLVILAGVTHAAPADSTAGRINATPPVSQPPVQQAPPPVTPQASPGASQPVSYADVWTPNEKHGVLQLHGGVITTVPKNSTGSTLGIRIGERVGGHAQLGVMSDWSFQTRKLLQPVPSDVPGLEPNIVLAQVDAHLVPAMAFIQVRLSDKFFLQPYLGAGGGYEWLLLKATDYRTAVSATATYANWAWQTWAGMGLQLDKQVRFDGELYFNGGDLKRDLTDANGVTWTETIDANAVGARIGLSLSY